MTAERGQSLLTEEPYSHILSQKERGVRCEWCFSRSSSLRKCTACGFLKYCDKKCQKRDWTVHKFECPCLKAVSPKVPMDSVRLMLRLIIAQNLKLPTNSEWSRSFEDLMTHETEIRADKERTEIFTKMMYTLKEYAGSHVSLPDSREIFNMFCKMTINSFSICDGELQAIGTGIYLSGSKLDHSCHPNAVATFLGTTLVVKATEKIPNPTPDKIFISYIEQLATIRERRNQLQQQYYFLCECDLCQDTDRDELMKSIRCPTSECVGSIYFDLTDDNVKPCSLCGKTCLTDSEKLKARKTLLSCTEWLNKLKEMRKTEDSKTRYQLCRKHVSETEGVLHNMNADCVHLLDQALDAAIDLEDWENALKYGNKTLKPYRAFYGQYSPNLAVQVFKVGKLQLYLGHLEEALKLLQEAESIFSVTHGTDHEIYKDIRDNIIQCTEELRIKLESSHT